MTEIYNILNDVKAKTIQAANTSDDDSRQIIQEDINKLLDAVGKIFQDTEFNGLNLFSSGGPTTFTIHYGGRKGQELVINGATAAVRAGADGTRASTVTLGTTSYVIDVTSQTKANDSIEIVDNLIKAVDKEAAKFGSAQIELEKIISNNETLAVNTRDAESRIRNIDFAKEMADFTKNNILMQSGSAMLAQAKQQSQLVLQLLR